MEIKYRTQFGELLNHYGLSGAGVEIGVAEGRNAEHIISWEAITKLYLIDSWQHLEQKGDGYQPQEWHNGNMIEAHRRLEKFKDKSVFLRGLSRDMIPLIHDDSLIYAYIDGDHSYVGALSDLMTIYPKVKSGGIISGHDYLSPAYGVGDATREFLKENHYLSSDIHVTEEDGDESMVSFWFIKK